jgi:hypothetical protein
MKWNDKSSCLLTLALGTTQPPIKIGTGGSFPGVKRPQPKANHSPPSSVEVKNEWSYTAIPAICLQGVYKEKSTFNLLTDDGMKENSHYAF